METKNTLPIIEYLSVKENEELSKHLQWDKAGWVRVGEKKFVFSAKYATLCSDFCNFEVRPTDTWVVTHPRSGTTWTQEMMWLLSHNLDFETAKSITLSMRFPFFESSLLATDYFYENVPRNPETESVISAIDNSHKLIGTMPGPRFIKSHFPFSLNPNLLKSNCKVVYVARNPKDVAVSYYHLQRDLAFFNFEGDFETFWNYFQSNKLAWGPYWEHVKEGWAQRHNSNVLFLFYEEMKHDLLSVVKKAADFLGKTYTDEQYQKLVNHLDFSVFKKNEMVNDSNKHKIEFFTSANFIRQGRSQAWHKMFTPELNAKANKWIEDNLKDTDLRFPHVDIYC